MIFRQRLLMKSRGELGPAAKLVLDVARNDFDVVFAHAGRPATASCAQHGISLTRTDLGMPTTGWYVAPRGTVKSERSKMDDTRS